MAKFSCDGLDDFCLSLQEIAEIPDEVETEMLDGGSDIVRWALKQALTDLDMVDTGQLRDSIRTFPKRFSNGVPYELTYPYGGRKIGKFKRYSKIRIKGTKKYTIKRVNMTNNDVGFVLEFGAPHRGIPARPWMSVVAEKYSDQIEDKMGEIYFKWLESKNL